MKNLLFIILTITVFNSCGSNEDKSRLNKKTLNGVWFVNNVNLIDTFFKDFKPIKYNTVGEKNQIINVYHFDENNNFTLDSGSAVIIKGTYKIEDSVITLNGKDDYKVNLKFTALPNTDSLKMRLYTDYVNTNVKLVYEFKKIKTGEIINDNWKNPLVATATDIEIKKKLKETLGYYCSYFRTLSEQNVTFFMPGRIILPLQFYDGGVGMLGEEKMSPDFIKIMGGKENAIKAHKMLDQAFNVYYIYPKMNSNILEYSYVLSHLKDEIK